MDNKNTKINFDFANLLILYKHYKDYLLPLGVIIASVLIVFLVVVPQFQQYFNAQDELRTQVEKLQLLKNNYNFLVNLDDAKTASDFGTLSFALPAGKDFAGIMDAISYVSAKTGVPVGDFSFALGNLSNVTEGVTAFPSVKIDVSLTGSSQDIMRFIDELYKTVPICEVTTIKTGGTFGSITILFYYKPFPSQQIDETAPIVALSGKDQDMIKNISAWNNITNQAFTPVVPSVFSGSLTATSSAAQNSGPF